MGRLQKVLSEQPTAAQQREQVDQEIERLDFRPDDIDADTWALIQENGRLATERLYQILSSPKFLRLRAGDQAKLISLAQNRAYGMPKTNKAEDGRRKGTFKDVTAEALNSLVHRASLPEYQTKQPNEVDDAEEL